MKLRFKPLYALALVPALLIAGCGEDSNSSFAPDTTPPLAPVIDGARGSAESVTIWWEPNVEADLAGYLVYQVNEDGSVDQVTPRLIHNTFYGKASNKDVRLYVTAVDLSRNESSASATLRVELDREESSRDRRDAIEGVLPN